MSGDAELAAFCRAEWPRLAGSLSLYTGDRDLAEELAQEALVRVCERWLEVRNTDSPSAWAHRVAFNLAKSHYRRRAVLRRIHRLEAAEPPITEPDTAQRVALRAALRGLADAQRQVLILRYYADLSVDEVAALMGCPANTVKTHTRRALQALRDAGLGDDDVEICLTAEGTP
jgi:RNA polymerase sigma-70 factor (sigma-E family)